VQVIVVIALVLAVIGPVIAPFQPETADPGNSASYRQACGTPWAQTTNGMDVPVACEVASPRTDLSIAVLGALGAILFGVPLDCCGILPRLLSEVLMRLSDIVQSFPVFLLGMALVVVTGQDSRTLSTCCRNQLPNLCPSGAQRSVVFARATFRGGSTRARRSDHWIVREHIFPIRSGRSWKRLDHDWRGNSAAAGLSFIGAGVRVPTPEWGFHDRRRGKDVYTRRVVAVGVSRACAMR